VRRTKYLEWKADELREAMREDKSIEAAVLNTLYLDLVRGLREQRKVQRQQSVLQAHDSTASAAAQQRESRKQYEVMMRAVLADGLVHPLEKAMLSDFASKHQVAHAEHVRILQGLGWTAKEYEVGIKGDLQQHANRVRQYRTGDYPSNVPGHAELSSELRRHGSRATEYE